MNCSVFILSATLSSERKKSFFNQKLPDREDYPLITIQPKESRIETLSAGETKRKDIEVQMLDNDIQDTAKILVEKAKKGMCVIWIANTVRESQEYYKSIISEKSDSDSFKVGLLHSCFPAYRREELEKEWIDSLGKNGDRPEGCVLIGTQIVEQSVDIDADFMISDLAPTDMLLQRMGRLWRHQRTRRTCSKPEFLIRCKDVDNCADKESLEEALGKSRYIYAPYVLWRSYQIWKGMTVLSIPEDIRELLESTYKTLANEPQFIIELKEKLEDIKKELRLKALGSTAEALLELPDDEYVATRYSSQIQIQVLLVRHCDSKGISANLVLINGDNVFVDAMKRDFNTTRKLYQNIVPLNKNYFRKYSNFHVPEYLSKHIYGDLIILKRRDDGNLVLTDERQTNLAYDDLKGVYRIEYVYSVDTEKEYDDEFDW